MNAQDVMASLHLRWPDTDYLHIEEAPEGPDRGGRKLDLLVVSLWRSRGLLLDGVEVKVSYSDWRRERDNAAKADRWWARTNRFWLAVPEQLAVRVRDELPPTWGLLACSAPEKPPVVVVKAQKRDREDIAWPVMVGLLRTVAGCGRNALDRARAEGIREGACREGERKQAAHPNRAHDELLERVREFEAASGLRISDRWTGMEDIGRIAALAHQERANPGWIHRNLDSFAAAAETNIERLLKEVRATRKLADMVRQELKAPGGEAA